MNSLRFTLLGDGTSDSALVTIINWLLRRFRSDAAWNGQLADLSRLDPRPRTLADRMYAAVRAFPCDVLFVHRDAEREEPAARRQEIAAASSAVRPPLTVPYIPIIPVRMTEAWLLTDEMAIRMAAGNRNGTVRLPLPRLRTLEAVPDPKEVLHNLLRTATELPARRRSKFHVTNAVRLVALYTDDFSPLLQLSSFRALADQVSEFCQTLPEEEE